MQNQQSNGDHDEFVSWLADQLKVSSHEELQEKLKQMGPDGIKKAYEQFQEMKQKGGANGQQEEGDDEQAQSMKQGGKLDYIKCLQAFKRGGAMEAKKCGCGTKMQAGGPVMQKDNVSYVKPVIQPPTATEGMNGSQYEGMLKRLSPQLYNKMITQRDSVNNSPISLAYNRYGVMGAEGGRSLTPQDSKKLDQYYFDGTEGPSAFPAADKLNFVKHLQQTYGGNVIKNAKGGKTKSMQDGGQPEGQDVESSKKGGEVGKKEKKQMVEPTWNKKGGKAKDPSKMVAYDVPVSKAGSRMSTLDASPDDSKPSKGTDIQPKWAKKATKNNTKPKSNDVKQDHHKDKKGMAPKEC